jgi:hypothetical protein
MVTEVNSSVLYSWKLLREQSLNIPILKNDKSTTPVIPALLPTAAAGRLRL